MISSPHLKWYGLALLSAVQFMVVLDIAIVNVALPSIQVDLNFSQANLQWVISAYALVFGGFLLLGGRTADVLGRRRIFIAGIIAFTIGSLLCGLAWSEASLIGARAVQGLGAAAISPAALAILMTSFREGRDRNIALGGWGGRLRSRCRRPARRPAHRFPLVGVDLLREHPRRCGGARTRAGAAA
jgi:MFS family permease